MKCRSFDTGYIFSASSPPYSYIGAKDSFEQIEKNGKNMKENIDEIRKEFYSRIKDINNKVEIIGEPLSSFILINCENVDKLLENLKKMDFMLLNYTI